MTKTWTLGTVLALLVTGNFLGGCAAEAEGQRENVAETAQAVAWANGDWWYSDSGVTNIVKIDNYRGSYGVCAAYYSGWQIGKILNNQCWIAYSNYDRAYNLGTNLRAGQTGAVIVLRQNYYYNYYWVDAPSGSSFNSANHSVEGDTENGQLRYVCAAWSNESQEYNPGKYVPEQNKCFYAYSNIAASATPGAGGCKNWANTAMPCVVRLTF